jgi:hypothetical protein
LDTHEISQSDLIFPEGVNNYVGQVALKKIERLEALEEARIQCEEIFTQSASILHEKGVILTRSVSVGSGPGVVGMHVETRSYRATPGIHFKYIVRSELVGGVIVLEDCIDILLGSPAVGRSFQITIEGGVFGEPQILFIISKTSIRNFDGEEVGYIERDIIQKILEKLEDILPDVSREHT